MLKCSQNVTNPSEISAAHQLPEVYMDQFEIQRTVSECRGRTLADFIFIHTNKFLNSLDLLSPEATSARYL